MTDAQALPREWIVAIKEYTGGYGFTAKQSIIPTLADFQTTLEYTMAFGDVPDGWGQAWERNCIGQCDPNEFDGAHVHDYEEPGRGRYKIWRLLCI